MILGSLFTEIQWLCSEDYFTMEGALDGPWVGIFVGFDEGEDAVGAEVTGDRVGSLVGSEEILQKQIIMISNKEWKRLQGCWWESQMLDFGLENPLDS